MPIKVHTLALTKSIMSQSRCHERLPIPTVNNDYVSLLTIKYVKAIIQINYRATLCSCEKPTRLSYKGNI